VTPFTEGVAVRSAASPSSSAALRAAPALDGGDFTFLVALASAAPRVRAADVVSVHAGRGEARVRDLPIELILEKVDFNPGDQLSTYCGLIGTGLMVIAAIYPISGGSASFAGSPPTRCGSTST